MYARWSAAWPGVQVVVVGHALHHDLRALRLDYLPVIDTSLLLSYKCAAPTTTISRGKHWHMPH